MPQGHQKNKKAALLGGILMGEVLGQTMCMVSLGQLGQTPVQTETRRREGGAKHNPGMLLVDGRVYVSTS